MVSLAGNRRLKTSGQELMGNQAYGQLQSHFGNRQSTESADGPVDARPPILNRIPNKNGPSELIHRGPSAPLLHLPVSQNSDGLLPHPSASQFQASQSFQMHPPNSFSSLAANKLTPRLVNNQNNMSMVESNIFQASLNTGEVRRGFVNSVRRGPTPHNVENWNGKPFPFSNGMSNFNSNNDSNFPHPGVCQDMFPQYSPSFDVGNTNTFPQRRESGQFFPGPNTSNAAMFQNGNLQPFPYNKIPNSVRLQRNPIGHDFNQPVNWQPNDFQNYDMNMEDAQMETNLDNFIRKKKVRQNTAPLKSRFGLQTPLRRMMALNRTQVPRQEGGMNPQRNFNQGQRRKINRYVHY